MNTVFPALSARSPLRASVGALTAAVLVLSGCASTGAPQQSSMARYDQLQAQPDGVRSFRAPGASAYRYVQIDEADIQVAAGTKVTPDQATEARVTLRAALASRFSDVGLRSEGAAPRLRLRATITGVETANPAVNAITTVLLLAPVSRGGLTVEIEALDAATGERVAAMAYEGRAGVKDLTRAYSSMGHASIEADRAARRFAALIAPDAQATKPAGHGSAAPAVLAAGRALATR